MHRYTHRFYRNPPHGGCHHSMHSGWDEPHATQHELRHIFAA